MDLLENGQGFGHRLELLKELRLVLAGREQALEGVHVRRVVVAVQLEHGSVLMPEHALLAKVAGARLVESATIVGLEFVAVQVDCHGSKLLLRVRVPALVFEAALSRLYPVAAELALLEASLHRVKHWEGHRVASVEV